MPNVAFGSPLEERRASDRPQRGRNRRQASDRPQRGHNRPASCRGGFEGGAKCLTSPSEAHKKRGGRLIRTGHREAATGLPAAEEGLKAVQNA